MKTMKTPYLAATAVAIALATATVPAHARSSVVESQNAPLSAASSAQVPATASLQGLLDRLIIIVGGRMPLNPQPLPPRR